MATVVKDFKIKSGLIVEGTTGKINNFDILTKKQADQDYIIGLIGGSSDSANTPNTVVKRNANGDFAAGTVTVNRVTFGDAGFIADDDGDLVLDTTNTGDDVIVNADDIRLNAGDDFLVNADGDVSLTANGGNILLQSPNIYAGTNIGYTDAERVATQGYVDQAETDAVSAANSHTDLALEDYTPTNSLDATVGGYGYIKNADLNGYALESYVDQAELDAVATANSYTDGEISDLDASLKLYADQAETDAKAYTDTRETAITTAYQAYADQAELDAISAAEDYTDTAIANLIDSAPATLDTLNELAAALQDNPDIISDLQDIAAGKQDTLTEGANIDITNNVISVTGLDTDDVAEGTNLYFTDQRAVTANSGLWDVYGSAATAGQNAENFAQGLVDNLSTTDIEEGSNLYFTDQRALNATSAAYDPAGSAADALQEAKDYADALDTDDIAEAANLYFTDSRAKSSAADLLTNATLSNITITGTGAGLTITAENGVAQSTTDDLAEGEENLYFSDERAIDAVSNADIYPNAVIIDNVAKQVASQLTAATAGVQVAHAWAKADYRSAEFLVKVAYGDHTEISKVLLTLDVLDNISITEYGVVGTNGSASSISAGISGTDVQLLVTTNNNDSTVTVVGTLLK